MEGTLDVRIYAAHDNGEILHTANVASGGSVFDWFAAQPGTTFRVAVKSYYGVTKMTPYLFTALFTGVADANEPNEDNQHATPITVNNDVAGYFFSGLVDSTNPSATSWYDFFVVDLDAKHVTIALQPPTDMTASVILYDGNGSQVADVAQISAGSTVVLERDIATAGKYYINAGPYYLGQVKGDGSTLPPYFTHPYRLTVSQ